MWMELIEYIQQDCGITFSIVVPYQNGQPQSKLVVHSLGKVLEHIGPMFHEHPWFLDEISSLSLIKL